MQRPNQPSGELNFVRLSSQYLSLSVMSGCLPYYAPFLSLPLSFSFSACRRAMPAAKKPSESINWYSFSYIVCGSRPLAFCRCPLVIIVQQVCLCIWFLFFSPTGLIWVSLPFFFHSLYWSPLEVRSQQATDRLVYLCVQRLALWISCCWNTYRNI